MQPASSAAAPLWSTRSMTRLPPSGTGEDFSRPGTIHSCCSVRSPILMRLWQSSDGECQPRVCALKPDVQVNFAFTRKRTFRPIQASSSCDPASRTFVSRFTHLLAHARAVDPVYIRAHFRRPLSNHVPWRRRFPGWEPTGNLWLFDSIFLIASVAGSSPSLSNSIRR